MVPLMLVERSRDDFFKIWFLDEYMSGHKGYIAGGCFKSIFSGEKNKDIDMFFEDKADFDKALSHFQKSKGYHPFYDNENVNAFMHDKTGIVIERQT